MYGTQGIADLLVTQGRLSHDAYAVLILSVRRASYAIQGAGKPACLILKVVLRREDFNSPTDSQIDVGRHP